MPQDVVRTIKNLITQATEEKNENAARNAAIQACRLIKLHGLTLLTAAEISAREAAKRSIADAVQADPEVINVETAQQIGSAIGSVLGSMVFGRTRSGGRRSR